MTVRLSEPFGPGPETFFPYVLPAHILEQTRGVINAGLATAPVGSGPYRLTSWERGARWLLERSDTADGDAVRTLEVVFPAADDRAERFYESQAVVWTWADPETARTISRDALGSVTSAATGRWVGAVFDVRDRLLASSAFRRALVSLYPLDQLRSAVYAPEPGAVDQFPQVSAAHRDDARPSVITTAAGACSCSPTRTTCSMTSAAR